MNHYRGSSRIPPSRREIYTLGEIRRQLWLARKTGCWVELKDTTSIRQGVPGHHVTDVRRDPCGRLEVQTGYGLTSRLWVRMGRTRRLALRDTHNNWHVRFPLMDPVFPGGTTLFVGNPLVKDFSIFNSWFGKAN